MSLKIKGNIDFLGDFDRKKEEIAQKLAENTPIDTGEARAGWRVTRDGIENDVEHISELNAGSSEQAPSHFVEKTVLSFRGVRPNGIIVKEN